MITYATVVGRNVRKTKKGTEIATYCLEIEKDNDSFDGQNVYRYDQFNPKSTYEVGERVVAVLDRYEQEVTDLTGDFGQLEE